LFPPPVFDAAVLESVKAAKINRVLVGIYDAAVKVVNAPAHPLVLDLYQTGQCYAGINQPFSLLDDLRV